MYKPALPLETESPCPHVIGKPKQIPGISMRAPKSLILPFYVVSHAPVVLGAEAGKATKGLIP